MHLAILIINNTRMVKTLNYYQAPYIQDETVLGSSK